MANTFDRKRFGSSYYLGHIVDRLGELERNSAMGHALSLLRDDEFGPGWTGAARTPETEFEDLTLGTRGGTEWFVDAAGGAVREAVENADDKAAELLSTIFVRLALNWDALAGAHRSA